MRWLLVMLLVCGGCVSDHASESPQPTQRRDDAQVDGTVSTFSIVAFDSETKELGIAVTSKFLAVGSVVPYAQADIGAIATQASANVTYGPKILKLLSEGKSAQEALEIVTNDDPRKEVRQLGVVDGQGRGATFTGEKCLDWAGGRTGKSVVAQGNLLASEKVVDACIETFESTEGTLARRLVAALQAGEDEGGDKRDLPWNSAALLVVRDKGGYAGANDRFIDLRVDNAEQPIAELEKLLTLHEQMWRGKHLK